MGILEHLDARFDELGISPGNIEERVEELLEKLDQKHKVKIEEGSFTLQHSLKCRLSGDMWNCSIHKRLSISPGYERPNGVFWASIQDGVLDLERAEG